VFLPDAIVILIPMLAIRIPAIAPGNLDVSFAHNIGYGRQRNRGCVWLLGVTVGEGIKVEIPCELDKYDKKRWEKKVIEPSVNLTCRAVTSHV
jgi:hypothetical protein